MSSSSSAGVTGTQPPAGSFVRSLFPSLAEGELSSRFFPSRRWVHDRGPLERLTGIADSLLAPTLAGLVDLSPHEIIAYANGTARSRAEAGGGERPYLRLPRSAAAFVHQQGMSIEVQYLNESVPCVSGWLRSLVHELGIPGGKHAFCCAIVSPKGEALPVHFDDIEVISVQLSGRKRWWIAAPDEGGRFPLSNSFDLARRPGAYPPAIPELSGAPTLEMERGSVVFLPRGHWHRTEAVEPSANLVFVLDTPMSFEVVLEALKNRMVTREAWRRTVAGSAREETRRLVESVLAGPLDELLERLSSAIPEDGDS